MTESRPRHTGDRTSRCANSVPDWVGAPSLEGAGPELSAGINMDALLARRAVTNGDVAVAVTVTMHGEIDAAALERTGELLEDLATIKSVVVVDLYRARCRTGRLLAELTDFRARRRRLQLETQLHGLHPGVIPDLEAADLTEVFGAYRDAHRPPGSR